VYIAQKPNQGGILGLGILLSACGAKTDVGPKPRPAPLVVVETVAARDVNEEIRAPVELRPVTQADVGSKTLGVLDSVLVERGDEVKRGQLLAIVRPSDLPDQLVAARGSVLQTEAAVALARKNLERVRGLAPSGVVSQQELQLAETALATAEAQRAAASANVAGYTTRLGETRIAPPLDGVVLTRRLDPGALVGPQVPGAIVTVARVDVLRASVTVTERDVARVKVGQEAMISVDALGKRRFLGRVARLSPALDPATRTLDAEVELGNASRELRPGMFARGAIVVGTRIGAPVIAATSMQVSANKRYVFVLKAGDKVERREIETGTDEGDWLEVRAGLAPGETIVTVGIDTISDGAVVRPSRGVDPFRPKAPAGAGSSGQAK